MESQKTHAMKRRQCRRHLALLVGSLAAMGVWANLSGYGEVFLGPSKTNLSFETMRYAYYGGSIIASLLFAIAPRFFETARRSLELCIPLLVSFSTLCYALAYYQSLLEPLLLGGSASFALGFCYLWIVATLYIVISQTASARQIVIAALAAQVAEQLLSVLAAHLLASSAQIALCLFCPLVSLIAFAKLRVSRTAPLTEIAREAQHYSRRARRHTYLLQAASGAAIVAMGAASSIGSWGNIRTTLTADGLVATFTHTLIACLFMVGLVVAFLLPMIHRPLSYRYQTAFLVIAASIMLAELQPGFDPAWRNAFDIVQNAVEFFSHVMLWTILALAIRDTNDNPYFLAGVSLAPYSILSFAWLIIQNANTSAPSFVLVFVSYLLVLIVAVHPRRLYERELPQLTSVQELNEYTLDGEPEIPLESNGAIVVDLIERRCELVGRSFGLSAREMEVLSLLAQGRSRPAIQRQLVLSEGTVKTHISHIYEKMNVGSLQDALDLIYETTSAPPSDASVK